MPAKTRKQKEAEAAAREASKATVGAALAAIGVIEPAPVIVTSKGRAPITGRTIFVPCPLYPEVTDDEGNVHKQLEVGFRVDLKHKYLASVDGPEPDVIKGIERYAKGAAMIAPKFLNWEFLHPETNFPVPVPNPLVWESYLPLFLPQFGLGELGLWIVGLGISQAAALALGQDPNSVNQFFTDKTPQEMVRSVYGGPGFDAALEGSLPNASGQTSPDTTQSEPLPLSA